MAEIIGSPDCGNSPRNKFAQDVAIALEVGADKPEQFDAKAVWTRSSEEHIRGRDALIAAINAKRNPDKIIVEHAISHGKTSAVSGEVILATGESYRFCHVIAFTTAKANCVAAVVSYG